MISWIPVFVLFNLSFALANATPQFDGQGSRQLDNIALIPRMVNSPQDAPETPESTEPSDRPARGMGKSPQWTLQHRGSQDRNVQEKNDNVAGARSSSPSAVPVIQSDDREDSPQPAGKSNTISPFKSSMLRSLQAAQTEQPLKFMPTPGYIPRQASDTYSPNKPILATGQNQVDRSGTSPQMTFKASLVGQGFTLPPLRSLPKIPGPAKRAREATPGTSNMMQPVASNPPKVPLQQQQPFLQDPINRPGSHTQAFRSIHDNLHEINRFTAQETNPPDKPRTGLRLDGTTPATPRLGLLGMNWPAAQDKNSLDKQRTDLRSGGASPSTSHLKAQSVASNKPPSQLQIPQQRPNPILGQERSPVGMNPNPAWPIRPIARKAMPPASFTDRGQWISHLFPAKPQINLQLPPVTPLDLSRNKGAISKSPGGAFSSQPVATGKRPAHDQQANLEKSKARQGVTTRAGTALLPASNRKRPGQSASPEDTGRVSKSRKIN